MRIKTAPKYFDTTNYIPSQQPASQGPSQDVDAGFPMSQATSTPNTSARLNRFTFPEPDLSPIVRDPVYARQSSGFNFDDVESVRSHSTYAVLPDDDNQSMVSRATNISGGVNRFQQQSATQPKRRGRRRRAGEAARHEIYKLQRTTNALIPKAPFARLVREIIHRQTRGGDYRIQGSALTALQEASENLLIQMFEAANMCTLHARRVTLKNSDINLVRMILSHFGIEY